MADLKSVLDAVLADKSLKPELVGGVLVTHCNACARKTAQAMGCDEFDDMNDTADIMYSIMALNVSGRWKKVDGPTAVCHALDNRLAFAALPSSRLHEAHGHIAPVACTRSEWSGSFNMDVPVVANAGKKMGYMPVSQAFPVAAGLPDFFVYLGKEA